MTWDDTIVAISTPPGMGALGIIRLSGPEALSIASKVFHKDLSSANGHTLHYGKIMKGETVLDEAVAAVFRAPKSFTKEDIVEFSCHGSSYILREVLQLLVSTGARLANPGEFTQRAYINGAMDLAQAEAVADLIASTSAGAHQLAIRQMRGGVSNELKTLRGKLLDFTSLIELELDFGEEDVEFADRTEFLRLIDEITDRISELIGSFRLGNALKQGVPTVILGKPNAGKSTLLNALLNENRAIVSEIAGTTRDMIEDRLVIEGVEFRLQDTAGVRETGDVIEAEGVRRSLALAAVAGLVLYMFDLTQETLEEAAAYVGGLELDPGTGVILVGNKADLVGTQSVAPLEGGWGVTKWQVTRISAKAGHGLNTLRTAMVTAVESFAVRSPDQVIISNVRHVHALEQAREALAEVVQAIDAGLPTDLMTIDIRRALHHIGEITGEISNDEVLGNIFGKFCIGK